MKLATIHVDGRDVPALVDDASTFTDISSVPGASSVLDVIDNWGTVKPALESAVAAGTLPTVRGAAVRAPIPNPRRNIFAVGKNYREHVAEFGRSGYDTPDRSEELPTKPVVFSKATTAVTGPYDSIDSHPDVTAEVDYEAELAVVIGRGGRTISADDALAHVWGYTVLNDVTARDLQRDHKQWLLGKSLDTYAPTGPWLVSADEVGDIGALRVSSTVNGEKRQDAAVSDLIFTVPQLIATISAGITLLAGDIIATGTPAGVGIGFTPPRFLRPGDVVECSIDKIGSIRNTVR